MIYYGGSIVAFDAQQKKINDILSGDFKYVIPRYQRKYVWQEKQWRELLEDIKYCLEVDASKDDAPTDWTHFLGSFVFEKQEKSLIVIDGQQRLTTITIMLCAICVLFNEHGEENRFRGVTKYIIGTDDMGDDYVRVDNQDLKNFQLIVAESTDYNPLLSKSKLFSSVSLVNNSQDNVNVKQCFEFFYNQFTEMIQDSEKPCAYLGVIKDKIMGLDVIDIRATNQQESYNIFEILNARGVDLKQHELIKNFIFKYIHPKAQIDTAKIKWDTFESKLYIKRASRLDPFFTHYVSHRYEKPSNENTEFRILKQYCDRSKMVELLDDLSEKASYYRLFFCPEECENRVVQETLQFFLDNNHRQFRPLFLSVIAAYKHKKISEAETEQFFQRIKNFYFAYGVVCNGKSNTIEDMVYQYARKIETENSSIAIHELMDKLLSHYPPYHQFESHFVLMGWSHKLKTYNTSSKKKEVQYILSEIENYYLSHNKELLIREFTIEHIANDDGSDSHCTIGNLLMLAQPINGNAADKCFSEKIPIYRESNFITTKNFIDRFGDKDDRTDEDISTRARFMSKLAYEKIWHFDNI